ncbi:hypothetical protein GMPD_38600 [Geomonas paludis]|uniref:Uncharacterized protein n=1 Tax=Geomonas paludis TaxID=2740185 RepID=A0A6V8N0L4_9BACT|nr:hypothetical protein GMPD_38600 [Geomonas paludis]
MSFAANLSSPGRVVPPAGENPGGGRLGYRSSIRPSLSRGSWLSSKGNAGGSAKKAPPPLTGLRAVALRPAKAGGGRRVDEAASRGGDGRFPHPLTPSRKGRGD